MSATFDPYHKWPGIPPREQPPHHYRLLGVSLYEDDPDVIQNAADQRMSHIKGQATGAHSEVSQQLLNEVSAAKLCLLHPQRKAEYDNHLRAMLAPPPLMPPGATAQTAAPYQPDMVPTAMPVSYQQQQWGGDEDGNTEDMIQQWVGDQNSEDYLADVVSPRRSGGLQMAIVALVVLGAVGAVGYFAINNLSGTDELVSDPGKQGTTNPGSTDPGPGSDPNPKQAPPPREPELELPPAGVSIATVEVPHMKAVPLSGDRNWQGIPEFLEGAEIYSTFTRRPSEETGELNLMVRTDGLVCMAPSWVHDGTTSLPTQSLEDLLAKGWKNAGTMKKGTHEVHSILWRTARAGETFRIRTRRTRPPYVIVMRPRSSTPPPPPSGNAVDLLALTDPERYSVSAGWNKAGGVLISHPGARPALMQIPYAPPEEYEITIVASRRMGSGTLAVGLIGEGHSFQATLGGYQIDPRGPLSGLERMAGDALDQQTASAHRGQLFRDTSDVTIVCTSRNNNVRVRVGDQMIANYNGPFRLLQPIGKHWTVPDPRGLYIGTYETAFRVTKLELRPLSGTGQQIQLAMSATPITPPDPGPDTTPDTTPNPPVETTRLAVPSQPEIDAADKLVKELFADEYSKANDAGGKQVLSARLFQQALESGGDPGGQFVLFRNAADLAADSGKVSAAFQVIDEWSSTFDVDKINLKTKALEQAAPSARNSAELKDLAERYITVLKGAVEANRFDDAVALAIQAGLAARKAKDPVFIDKVRQGTDELKKLQADYETARSAHELLSEQPNDPKANGTWGSFLCLRKRDWEQGLPYLAKGDNPKLAAAAKADVGHPTSPGDQMSLGDDWWSLADEQPDEALKRTLQMRAAHWYRKVLPNLNGGLTKAKVEKRLEEVDATTTAFPRGQFVELLSMTETNGRWKRVGNGIGIERNTSKARLTIPVAVEGSYELHVQFERTYGSDTIGVVLPLGRSRQCLLALNHEGKTSGLLDTTGDVMRDAVFSNRTHNLIVEVHTTGDETTIVSRLDGRSYVRWQGRTTDLGLPGEWSLDNSNALGLAAGRVTVLFKSVRIKMISGDAKPF